MLSDPLPAIASVRAAVAAPPEALWPLVADPTVPARFSNELVAAAFASGDVAAVGAVIEGTNGRGDATWSTSSTVIECDPPRRFAWATGGATAPAATWAFEVEAADGGATLTHSVVLHPDVAPLGTAVAAAPPDAAREIVDSRLAELVVSMEAVVAGIAAMAEAG